MREQEKKKNEECDGAGVNEVQAQNDNPKQIQEAQKRLKSIDDTLNSIQRRVRKMEEMAKK